MATDTERAWAAGFFDGEGHVGCHGNHGGSGRRLVLSISQNERTTLDRFQAAVGGVGSVRPRKGKPPRCTAVWFAYESGNKADIRAIVDAMWPWLSGPKRAQTTAAFAAHEEFNLGTPDRRRAGALRQRVEREWSPTPKSMADCPGGHGWADFLVRKDGSRQCRPCFNEYQRQYRARRGRSDRPPKQ